MFGYQKTKQLIGFIFSQKKRRYQWKIITVTVTEAIQGQGSSRQLLTYVLKQIKEQSVRVINKTGASSGPALNAYKSLGSYTRSIVTDWFIEHYPEPVLEEGQGLKNQVILEKRR